MTANQIAEMANVSVATVHRWCLRDDLPWHWATERAGRGGQTRRIIVGVDLLDWLAHRGKALGISPRVAERVNDYVQGHTARLMRRGSAA